MKNTFANSLEKSNFLIKIQLLFHMNRDNKVSNLIILIGREQSPDWWLKTHSKYA